jgi:CPA1 family monovalent cation:H+ antiporter
VDAALNLLALVAVVGVVSALAARMRWSAPLALVVVGIGISFIPHFLDLVLTPEIVLVGLLPPLLYAAAIRTSLVDFRANRLPIGLLSVGLVAFSTLALGAVAYSVVPGISLAAAFALGAVVAPPDAVAATAVGRQVGMPRRILTILEGESLVNDATALVALNTAIAAIAASITPLEVGWDFVRAAGGGVAVGLAAAFVLAQIRRRITDPVLDTTLSFAAPYVAFLPAEEIKASGVLAVVVTGLVLGHRAPQLQSASSRISENLNWRTVQFLLENGVFLLIGLQVRFLVDAVRREQLSLGTIVTVCAVTLTVTILVRLVWVFGSTAVLRALGVVNWGWREATVISWAGMRGVVTLAAAFLLPTNTPRRELLALVAFVVVAGTLLIQGLTLPRLVRRLGLPPPSAAEDALQAASLVTAAAREGLRALDHAKRPEDPPEVLRSLRERAARRSDQIWEQLGRPNTDIEPPTAAYRRLRMQMLAAERASVLRARDQGTYDDEVLRSALTAIDVEESLLDRVDEAAARVDDDLVARPSVVGDCEHLRRAPKIAQPRTPGACAECLRDGTTWVHLRLCLACGHVGCCDSSIGRHATGHFRDSGHAVMRSAEPGEAWRWCFADELLG